MTAWLASTVVRLTGLYFVALAVGAFLAPNAVRRFLAGFAGSRRAHYLELGLRLAVGGALVSHAPSMHLAGLFTSFGWALVVTTAGMLVVPWRWHRRFAAWSVPLAVRHLPLLGLAALALGCAILLAAARGTG